MLLDLGLPPGQSSAALAARPNDGLDVLRAARARHDATPVIVLTARDDRGDRVAGLDAGADDYLVKPFALDELYARIRAVLRRHAGRAEPVLAAGDITLDPSTRRVTRAGAPVTLSAREFAVLEALMARPGPCCRGRSSKIACTAGAKRSRAMPFLCTCTSCARSSGPRRSATCAASAISSPPTLDAARPAKRLVPR